MGSNLQFCIAQEIENILYSKSIHIKNLSRKYSCNIYLSNLDSILVN